MRFRRRKTEAQRRAQAAERLRAALVEKRARSDR
jgi:hypothetical protein